MRVPDEMGVVCRLRVHLGKICQPGRTESANEALHAERRTHVVASGVTVAFRTVCERDRFDLNSWQSKEVLSKRYAATRVSHGSSTLG